MSPVLSFASESPARKVAVMALSLAGYEGLPQQSTTNWVAENNGNPFSHSFRVQKCKIKVSAGPRSLPGL